MEGQKLFEMGGVDYTNSITVPSYKVNSEPVTEDYTNINKIKYAQYIRDKVSGSFTLKFFKPEDMTSFFEAYQNLRERNGRITIKVYVMNLNQIKEIHADMKMTPADTMPYMSGGKSYDGFDVTITER